ncbi:MAG: PilT/PilU family type 4a pilus ATPase [Candidatus Omnitrophica bacterium]|nr:PilT/PilU family type 4a pilus ATPase [Candidatus Omnitrophota bacterium]MBU2044198.1 PilT/PilU family type 4a pilus ATPase [Candidatus Omnitrophota bacterium]MBU2266303.1 PilT/PilU family type 4a pilus ATPase [Candidatus Omnitrophota bacterium]MBU2473282.1 PilT/PilU family type 4a pilus ATPase [Candidatus Omnitrophota bacterium]
MEFKDMLELMIEKGATDIFLRVGSPLRGRINTEVETIREERLTFDEIKNIIETVARDRDRERLEKSRGCEFTYWYREYWRFRIGLFYQRSTPAMVVRKIDLRIPSFTELNLPSEVLEQFCKERRGLILLTGITGSGKSTTIASMIQFINNKYGRHVLTVEEPIEFTFQDDLSVINQREIGTDVESYQDALRQFALHSPDVMYIGNILDAETCHAALTAAETGVLVFSTLHTVNATSTIERIVNFFHPHQHNFVMNQLSFLLKGVLSQRLIPRDDHPGLIPAYEIMTLSPSISRLIKENKIWEIPKYITSGEHYGMVTFHQCLLSLVEQGKITPEVALQYADSREELELQLRNKDLI